MWDKPLDSKCQYCGDNRVYAWSSFEINEWEPDVHYLVETDDDIFHLLLIGCYISREMLSILKPPRNQTRRKSRKDVNRSCTLIVVHGRLFISGFACAEI